MAVGEDGYKGEGEGGRADMKSAVCVDTYIDVLLRRFLEIHGCLSVGLD